MLYNVPQLMTDMTPATLARLAAIDNLVGMKDSADLMHVQDVVFRTRGRNFRLLVGMEYFIVAGLLVGAVGATPSPANLYPRIYVDLYEKTMAGQVDEALRLQEQANRFTDLFDPIVSWMSTVKAAFHMMGLCGPTVAAPQPPLTAEETDLVRRNLSAHGLLS
jgi:4-hydroxy-tetrahydrodipicolinate synthase